MNEHNHTGNYNHIRCLTCGAAWLAGINERTGRMELGHPFNLPCSRQRPTGIAPTREWPEAVGGIPPGEFLAAVMARAHEKNGAKS